MNQSRPRPVARLSEPGEFSPIPATNGSRPPQPSGSSLRPPALPAVARLSEPGEASSPASDQRERTIPARAVARTGRRPCRPTLHRLLGTVALCLLLSASSPAIAAGNEPDTLRVGIVQMANAATLQTNRDRIVSGVAQAASQGVRVVVFPEGALRDDAGQDTEAVEQAVAAVAEAARRASVYVILGGWTYRPPAKKNANWMIVVDPQGHEIFRYDKLYDNHRAAMPGVFLIDGVASSAAICADRWLRGVTELPIHEGAQVAFELSNNFASEWVAPLQWYWYVPRALRNNVWVVFANSCNAPSAAPIAPPKLRHGHSAVIAPDGRIVAAAPGNAATIVVAELQVREATRAEALARAAHPALQPFWQAGVKLQQGKAVDAPPLAALGCKPAAVTLAAAQATGDPAAIDAAIAEAARRGADLVAFPALAIDERQLDRLEQAARENRITVVFGAAHRQGADLYNSAFVLGPDGSLLTRYDQLSAKDPYRPGAAPAAMWFRVKGVPAVVTLGRDALWTELAELAAVAGARIHIHLDHDPATGREADLRRLQTWSNLASYLTFTATVNLAGSVLWDDLRGMDETRAVVRNLPTPDTGAAEVYSPFSANLVARANTPDDLILATRQVPGPNPYHPARTSNFNPQMEPWYRLGAALMFPR
ncbi:MAG: nitrilase-related carbon-nitrogen hydrolase [Thermoguttaceae bacterium]